MPELNYSDVAQSSFHIISSEYPPQTGGVSDYTYGLAGQLGESGCEVQVWCPETTGLTPEQSNVRVNRVAGSFTPADLARLGRELNKFAKPRRILVQWVPHGFGFRSLNVAFCLWLWSRSLLRGDAVELMVHEAYLAFKEGSWRQDVAALIHRLMTIIILRAPKRIWISTPSWERLLNPYLLERRIPLKWLPIPSNIPVVDDEKRLGCLRQQFGQTPVWGHFGTFGRNVTSTLEPIFQSLLANEKGSILLIGSKSDDYRASFLSRFPEWKTRMFCTGALPAAEISLYLSVCDVMIQPYSDGASCKRGSLMAALAHHKPVVSNVGRTTEPFWATEQAICLASSSEAGVFVGFCKKLAADANERQRVSAAAGDLYSRCFDWERTISRLLTSEA